MREALRKCRVEVSGGAKVEEKPEKRSKDCKRKDSRRKESSMKKESVENAMKSLFGEDKSGEYRKFISENWELNE
jgi:hypothetical protein